MNRCSLPEIFFNNLLADLVPLLWSLLRKNLNFLLICLTWAELKNCLSEVTARLLTPKSTPRIRCEPEQTVLSWENVNRKKHLPLESILKRLSSTSQLK